MKNAVSYSWRLIARCALVAALGSVMPATAQTVSGQARAIKTSVVDPLGGTTTTALADTGTLSGSTDAREASAPTGSVPSVIAGNTLHATTIGWPDQVKSEASVAGLTVTVGATTVGANFVMARASAVRGLAGAGTASIEGLSINGLPITITGNPNQTITIPGGQVVINERPTSSTSTIVNALHIAVTGVADVIVASATAGIQ
jgi:hypothetical protein